MKLKADAYADYTGTDIYNLWLSEKRAQRIVDFLMAKGLTASRIIAKGHGNTNPISNCTKCTEEENRLNRRAELIIYQGDVLPSEAGSRKAEELVDSKKIVFRIQIFTSKERVFLAPANFNGMENVEEYQDEGLYKYVVELTYDYDYAKTVLLNEVRNNGYKDAFIVAFREGKRIPVKETMDPLNQ